MTRTTHQDAAATAVLRRTMVLLLLLLMFSFVSFPSVTAECPDNCWCLGVYVDCSNQKLDRIPDRIPPATTFLRLSFNKISEVKNGAFSNLSKLQTLYLDENKIENIETGLFNNLTSLEFLHLDFNKIHKLDLEMFKGLTKLKELYLSNNTISEVKNGLFSNLSKLQTLYLNRNKIENIETGLFNNLTSLEYLYLCFNKIHKLDLEMFKGLTKLKELSLSNNSISEVKNGAFSNLSKLQRLYLSNNNISEVKNGLFSNLSKLQTLYLDRNKIETIETGVFNNLTSLIRLNLAGNKIHKLDLEMFERLTNLKIMDLDNNMISEIPIWIFDSLTSLSELNLYNNPLTCDCDTIFFLNAPKKNYPRDVYWDHDPSCHFPVEMSEKSLKEITEKFFNCTSPDVIVVPEIKKVSVGEQLRLSCKAVGDPEPFITWSKDEIDLELGQRFQVFQNNTLIISKAGRTDGSKYKCVASNSLGQKSFEAMVNVDGTGIMCDRRLERRQAVSSSSENIDDKFNCLNGETIEWSLLCDGDEDCSDGSDETKELCALYEFETNTTMDCGRVHTMKNQATHDEAHQSIIELAPWTVAVYRKIAESKFEFIQSASIIAPNIVISWGFYFCTIRRNEYDLVKIGPMVKLLDDYKLLINVTMIYSTTYGNGDVYESNSIAVIVLANKLPLSYGFRPICIDWFSNYNIRKKTQMRIIGFKSSGNNSEVKVIQYLTHYTTGIDKTLSIKFNKDSHISGGFPGSGLGILHSNSYFLTGILRNWSLRNRNNLTEVDTLKFLDIKYHIPWIRGILNKHVTLNSCILPTIEGVVYTYEDSNESLAHGTFIDLHLTVNENCKFGYHKVYPNSFRVCQRNGKWKTFSDKLCLKMCPPLESDSLDIKCTDNGKFANCSNPSIPGTIAKPLCKPLYTAPNGHENEPLELLCQPNGAWDKKLYTCNPSCGKVHTITNGMIMGGKTAAIGTAPWNVGVYQINQNNSNNYDLICGGSIISPNLVVSVAHCFWKKGMLSDRISVNDGQYKIAVGKYSRNITTIDNEFTKIMNVTTVHLNEYYDGISGFHADDIAIVVLQNRISFSAGVSPICVDWTGINTIPNGAVGKIVGWGQMEEGIVSPILLEASLPYIDHSSCWYMYTNGFQSYVTKDKFCAGSRLGQGVLEGDSGAGLSFLHSNNLYYLTGVASVKDPDTNSSIAVFTEVKHHIGWISRLYKNNTL